MMTTTYENLKAAAGKPVEKLAAEVRALEKQVAKIEDRIEYERGDIGRREQNIENFKNAAAAKLATSTSAYCEWQKRFARLTVDLATARDGLALLETVILPKTQLARTEARGELTKALAALCIAARPAAEARMAALLGVVIAEHDAFLAACERIHQDYDVVFVPPVRYPGPRVESVRLGHFGKHKLTSPAKFLAFTLPPASKGVVSADKDPEIVHNPPEAGDVCACEAIAASPAPGPQEAKDANSTVDFAPEAAAAPESDDRAVDEDARGDDRTEKGVQGVTEGEIVEPEDESPALDGGLEAAEPKQRTILTGVTSHPPR